MTSKLTLSSYETPEEHALIELMVRRVNSATMINLGAAALIGVVALFAPFWKALVAVMACRLLIAYVSGTIGRSLARRIATGQPFLRTLNMLCASFFVGGTVWAAILAIVPIALWNSFEALSLIVLISVGVTIVTIIASPVPRAMWSFYGGFTLAMTALMLAHFDALGPLPYVWGGVTLLTSGLAIRISRDIRKTVAIDEENRRMADTLSHLNEELGGALDRADRLARYDQLTGVRNRRAFEEEAGAIAVRRDSEEQWYALLVDLDHFKAINDRHGHFIGDEVLRRVGAIMADVEKRIPYTISARLGGEEFALLLPGSGEGEIRAAAEAVRQQIERLQIDGGAESVRTSASFGLSDWHVGEPVHAALRRADAALYEAKEAGRNRVVSADDLPDDDDAVRAA